MIAIQDLRIILESLREALDADKARGDYNGAYHCGYFDALIQVGWRFGLVWREAEPHSPPTLTLEPPREDARELTDELKRAFYVGWLPAYVPIRWPEDLTEGLEEELRQGAVAARNDPPACEEDSDSQRGSEDALSAIAERCGIAPEAIGLTRRYT